MVLGVAVLVMPVAVSAREWLEGKIVPAYWSGWYEAWLEGWQEIKDSGED